MLTTFQRRERILELLQQQHGLRVAQLAELLHVSQGTIRNDLRALGKAGRLTRVRGGAVLPSTQPVRGLAFAHRVQANAVAKRQIARWAADLVEDGDTLILDASTTVYDMAQFLRDRHRLTVITNGIEVALLLSQDPTNSVMLIGGLVRPDNASVTGLLGEALLKDLHVKRAFVSASGLTLSGGLSEDDFQEAQLKSRMIGCAESVVALVDSSKFGKQHLSSFARLDQVSHIFVDSGLAPHWIEQLQQTGTTLSICDTDTVSSYMPLSENRHYVIGFANLSEEVPFAVDVRRGLERAAKEAGNVDLVLADNQLDGQVAVEVADRLIAKGIDLAIEYQIDEHAGDLIMAKFRRAGIPVIAVDIPMVGATFFGVDNYQAGLLAGAALGNWIVEHWGGQFDRLIVLEEPRAGALPAARIRGQLDGLRDVVGELPPEKMVFLNSGNTVAVSEANTAAALRGMPGEHRLAVIAFNDDAAVGALAAARRLGRESDVVIVGQGADRLARPEIRRPGSRLIGSTAYMPEAYGARLIALALSILRGESVPPAVHMNHVFVNAANIDELYPE